jgi:hypothetical protein
MTQYKRTGNCGDRFRAGERISDAFVESTVSRIVNADKRRVLSGLRQLIRRRDPAFGKPADNDLAPVS